MNFKFILICLIICTILSGCWKDNSQLHLNTSYSQTTDFYDSDIDTNTSCNDINGSVKIDEILVQGQEFAECYAKMIWQYRYGEAWEDYSNIKYFDFDDNSEDNFFEKDGVPFRKLLITDYTYDELMEYIKGFYTDEAFEAAADGWLKYIAEKDNYIFIGGYEPTFLYPLRNKRAQIIEYNVNNDGTVTYNCFSERVNDDSKDLYFSFTLDNGKLCADFDDSEMGLFNADIYEN